MIHFDRIGAHAHPSLAISLLSLEFSYVCKTLFVSLFSITLFHSYIAAVCICVFCCFTSQNVSICKTATKWNEYENSDKPVRDAIHFEKRPYQIISIQMNFTNRSKCGSGDVTKELRFIYWESISTHIFICSFWTWKSSQRLKQNIKLLDIDRKFYNRQCNPFDIAKRKRRKFPFASNTID